MHSYLLSAFRGAADGRLLKWDPLTRRTSVLADGFSYANGVALSADESFVAVVETVTARVFRHWLKGNTNHAHCSVCVSFGVVSMHLIQ